MKCKDCGGTLQSDHGEGLILECEACAKFPSDCDCRRRLGYLPWRRVNCLGCNRLNITTVDTTSPGWRGAEV